MPTITSNHYAVEFFQGPLLAPIDVEALGGANTAIAEGVSGTAFNAASPAARDPYSVSWFDADLEAGLSLPGAFTSMDYDNHGPNSPDSVNDFLYANLGARLQFGELGVAATADLLRYTVQSHGGLDVTAGRYHLLAAYGFFGNQLLLGGGARAVTMQLTAGSGLASGFQPLGASLFMGGVGPEVGAIVKPDHLPFRIGATFRSGVTGAAIGTGNTTTDASGVVRSGGVIVPSSITLPWELEAGFALQIGPRPLNPGWKNPHEDDAALRERLEKTRARRARELLAAVAAANPDERMRLEARLRAEEASVRIVEEQELAAAEAHLLAVRKAHYQNWPREKILVVASVLVTGASANAIALEDFLDQQVEPTGQSVTLSPRLGIEAEPIRDYLKGRIGSYLEPSRFAGVAIRQHFTWGFDIKLFAWNAFGLTPGQVWRISGAADVAPRYTNWGLSVGAWH